MDFEGAQAVLFIAVLIGLQEQDCNWARSVCEGRCLGSSCLDPVTAVSRHVLRRQLRVLNVSRARGGAKGGYAYKPPPDRCNVWNTTKPSGPSPGSSTAATNDVAAGGHCGRLCESRERLAVLPAVSPGLIEVGLRTLCGRHE